MSVRWVVRREDPRTLGEILAKSGNDVTAVEEGRVFIGRRRAKAATEPVAPGDVVTIAPAVEEQPAVILARESDLVAALKPAGIPTIADHGGTAHSLSANVARALGVPVDKVHATSRLDRDVSGVVIFALSKLVRERLQEARSRGDYHRRYVAITDAVAACTADAGVWNASIGRTTDPRHRKVDGHDAVAAETHWRVVAKTDRAALLSVSPITGRTHQIRVHASHASMPLLGDRVYGGRDRVVLSSGRVVSVARIALHAARVIVPGERGPLTVTAPIPQELALFWQELGGEPGAWDTALSCQLAEQ